MFTVDIVMSTKLQTETQTNAVATNVINSFVLNGRIIIFDKSLAQDKKICLSFMLVVFDFDNTIYTHSREGAPNSCSLTSPPENYKLSDGEFLHGLLTKLIQRGIHIGVASFGKKQIIIQTMNKIVGKEYFNEQNVMTAQDVPEFWAIKLQKYSKTFQTYVQNANNDLATAFQTFNVTEKPETNPKMYFCMDLGPQAKVQMIKQLCQHYNVAELTNVIYFDDNTNNVEAALQNRIQAYAVPPFTGITEDWFNLSLHSTNFSSILS